jgi:hypothetical protein
MGSEGRGSEVELKVGMLVRRKRREERRGEERRGKEIRKETWFTLTFSQHDTAQFKVRCKVWSFQDRCGFCTVCSTQHK